MILFLVVFSLVKIQNDLHHNYLNLDYHDSDNITIVFLRFINTTWGKVFYELLCLVILLNMFYNKLITPGVWLVSNQNFVTKTYETAHSNWLKFYWLQ